MMAGNYVSGKQIGKLIANDKPVISPPSNFEHTVHVGFDSQTGEFTVSVLITMQGHTFV